LAKIMILLKRQDHLSFEEFASWWLGQHQEMAAQMPKLRRACFNLVQGDEDLLYDGVSELWFDSISDFEIAYQSEIGKKVAADSLAHVSKRDRLIVEEHTVLGE
jgi:uncharacterized protein (TIGR02118 family)